MRKPSLVAVLLAAGALVGCAKAGDGAGNNDDDGADTTDDSDGTDISTDDSDDTSDGLPIDGPPPIDAPPPDAAPTMVTLAQTDNAIVDNGGIACGIVSQGFTAENSWYRVFDLAALGIARDLAITDVSFGVETSTAAQSIDVRIGTYTGALGGNIIDTALITPVTQTAVTVPAVNLQMQVAPISATIPAGSKVVIEIHAADREGQGVQFFLGTSTAAELSPAYLRAPTCGISQPQSMRQIQVANDLPPSSAIINVTGTY